MSVKDELIFQARPAGRPHALMGGGIDVQRAAKKILP